MTVVSPLHGSRLFFSGLLLAIANFIVVLDMTIANVSVPHIAGGLAISTSEGTYVITSYAVAEAITVPLTGWLALRFGTVRLFAIAMILFGVFSTLCGMSASLGFLVTSRVLQGVAGAPLMPLSQTLLLNIFPPEKKAMALALWSMTTLVAPILGPIFGGWICENWSWPFIFYVNIPIALLCGVAALRLLKPFESQIVKKKVDFVGMALLVLWVGALQLMLDKGKELDWFASSEICVLAVIASIGFCMFMIWELTEDHPIIDFSVFKSRGYSVSVLTMSLAFAAFFGTIVLTPLWLQSFMGYTAIDSGFVSAKLGILAVIAAPFAAKLTQKVDPRKLVFFGVSWLGVFTFIRSIATTDMTIWDISWPILFQGIGMPFFFVPLTSLALAAVTPDKIASAAGLMNFLRTLSGAFSASIVVTFWENSQTVFKSELVERAVRLPSAILGMTRDQGLYLFDMLVQSQAVMLATNHVMLIVSLTFILSALAIWFVPRPKGAVAMDVGH